MSDDNGLSAVGVILLIIAAYFAFHYHDQVKQLRQENQQLQAQVDQLQTDNSNMSDDINRMNSEIDDAKNALGDYSEMYDAIEALEPGTSTFAR